MDCKCIWTRRARSFRSQARFQRSMVYCQKLFLCRAQQQQRILPPSQGSLRIHHSHGVSPSTSPCSSRHFSNNFNSVLFSLNMGLGIWSLIPSAAERAANKVAVDDMQMAGDGSPVSVNGSDKDWEMKTVPRVQTSQVPYTPRTLAFNTLDRQLPLRVQPSGSARFA